LGLYQQEQKSGQHFQYLYQNDKANKKPHSKAGSE
jgi:hypothetical protein